MINRKRKIYHDFCKSYDRCLDDVGLAQFVTCFYRLLFEANASGHYQLLFKDTPQHKREFMLEQSIYSSSQLFLTPEVPRHLNRILKSHRSMGLTPEDILAWYEALLRTVEVCDPEFTAREEALWLAVLGPSLQYSQVAMRRNRVS